MTRIRSLLTIVIAIGCTTSASAQFFPPPIIPVVGVPVLVPNGVGFQYNSRRLQVGGFFGNGTYTPGVLPIAQTGGFPFAPGQPLLLYTPGYFPGAYPGYPYGSQTGAVTLQVINPPGIGGFRQRLGDQFDINGVDLDLEPPNRVGNPNPPPKQKAAQREMVERKAEVAKVAPPPEERKVEANVAKAPAVVAPKPKVAVVPDWQHWLDLGSNSFKRGDYGIAILRFRQAADDEPTIARSFFLQGQACLAVGKYQEAAELIQQGLKRDPAWHGSGFRPKAELYGNDEARWTQHLKRLELAQRQQPKNADYLFLLGYVAWFDGDRAAAIGHFQQARAMAADPQWADLFLKAAK